MVKSYQAKLRVPDNEKYPQAKDIMSRSIVTMPTDTDIFKAIDLLLSHQISGACVTDETGTLVGFISEKDCLKLIAELAYHENLSGGPVTNYMTRDVLTIDVDMGLVQIADIFATHPYRKLPVLEANRLVGAVRRRDALRAIQEHGKKRNHSFTKPF